MIAYRFSSTLILEPILDPPSQILAPRPQNCTIPKHNPSQSRKPQSFWRHAKIFCYAATLQTLSIRSRVTIARSAKSPPRGALQLGCVNRQKMICNDGNGESKEQRSTLISVENCCREKETLLLRNDRDPSWHCRTARSLIRRNCGCVWKTRTQKCVAKEASKCVVKRAHTRKIFAQSCLVLLVSVARSHG